MLPHALSARYIKTVRVPCYLWFYCTMSNILCPHSEIDIRFSSYRGFFFCLQELGMNTKYHAKANYSLINCCQGIFLARQIKL